MDYRHSNSFNWCAQSYSECVFAGAVADNLIVMSCTKMGLMYTGGCCAVSVQFSCVIVLAGKLFAMMTKQNKTKSFGKI